MDDAPGPVATGPICWKPLAELPAVLRQGNSYVHATCCTGDEPVTETTTDEETAERKQDSERAA